MLARFSLLFRLGLVLAVAPALVAAPVNIPVATADDDDDDDWDDDDDDDDDDGDEEEEDDEPQPAVTAGGMFTKTTYPVSELERTLLVIGGMFEARAGFDIDVGDQTAFDVWRFKLDARYGVQDNVELQGGANLLLTRGDVTVTRLHEIFMGVEAGLYFETVNVRLLGQLTIDDTVAQGETGTDVDVGFDLIGGVPFRYRFNEKIAIIALDKILTVHTTGGSPDLTIGVGMVFQIVPNAAAILRAEVTIVEFDTDVVVVPATAAIQFSPNNQFDIGAEFTFSDIKVDDAEMMGMDGTEKKFYDDRSLLLFGQARF
ncbi:MAG: hypothetical protein MJE77_36625 [Proteobacteria bacterium]|nr:hypothetical protein [Pseudomonadota bacterium]